MEMCDFLRAVCFLQCLLFFYEAVRLFCSPYVYFPGNAKVLLSEMEINSVFLSSYIGGGR